MAYPVYKNTLEHYIHFSHKIITKLENPRENCIRIST